MAGTLDSLRDFRITFDLVIIKKGVIIVLLSSSRMRESHQEYRMSMTPNWAIKMNGQKMGMQTLNVYIF